MARRQATDHHIDVTLTRLRDGTTLAKDACPPFDFFGGCLIVRTN